MESGGVAFLFSLFVTPLWIRFLTRRSLGQKIHEDVPSTHLVKAGTPTMGGVLIVVSAVLGYLMGHVGTSIVINSGIVHGKEPDTLDVEDLVKVRRQLAADGTPVDEVSDEDLRKGVAMFGEAFRDLAPLTAASAAQIILEGVRQNKWRILVGEDAVIVDQMVRDDPENAYEPEFWHTLQSRGLFGGFG